ncbi:MAG: cytochrome c [Verrucomicrobiales bacterium]|nr:cytochrome c [Verrucomicrobiales bacterium]
MNRSTSSLLAALTLSAITFPASASADEKAAAMRLGRMKAMSCAACHGMDGKGVSREGVMVAPPYGDSELVKRSPEGLALIILKGIQRESETYSTAMGSMAPVYDDRSLAAVMTWIRNQFGGHEDVITAEQVAAWREKHAARTEPVTHAEISEMVDAAP